ncbi:MAG: glycosyltransferase family 2 protein [Vulcanimicrobiota bacterium]
MTTIVIPCYNDWRSLAELLPSLEQALPAPLELLIVNDNPLAPLPEPLPADGFQRVRVMQLTRNLGHQRAICMGLSWLASQNPPDGCVLVMDADGEDRPEDAARLLQTAREQGVLAFAQRTRRSESLFFRLGYFFYRGLYGVLTGQTIRMGNFSAIPVRLLHKVTALPEIWTHYAAGIQRAKIPYVAIPTQRGHRLDGVSSMNTTALVTHGLSAVAVHSDRVGVRMLLVAQFFCAFFFMAMLTAIAVRLFTDWGIPGWATSAVGLTLILLTQGIITCFFFVFFVLGSRSHQSFIPMRDFQYSLDEVLVWKDLDP